MKLSKNIYIIDGYQYEEFKSYDELSRFILNNGLEKDNLRISIINIDTNEFRRSCFNNCNTTVCSIIDKIPLYEGAIYFVEGSHIYSKNIKDLIYKGFNKIIAFNPNAISDGISDFIGTNKEAAFYISRYARFRTIWIYENNVIEEFDVGTCSPIIDYNFIFGEAFNINDEVSTDQYSDNMIIGFYKTFGLGNDLSKYSRDAILNAKFNPGRDLELRYCMMDKDHDEIIRTFDSSQFKKIKRED